MELISIIRRNGVYYSLAILFNRMVPPALLRCRYFVVFELDPATLLQSINLNAGPASPARQDTAIFPCVTGADFKYVSHVTCFAPTSRSKYLAYGVRTDDEVIGGVWGAIHDFDETELGLRICLEPNQSWVFAALIKKEFRNQKLYPPLLAELVKSFQTHGTSQVLVSVNPLNQPSMRVHSKYARRKVGAAFVFRFLHMVICLPFGSVRARQWWTLRPAQHPVEIEIASGS